ncbi:hypothetical protein PENSPDRAFT_48129 [Peniophora sp. CONT]|nr:hypothetical protein PENSPDRAFT_48129 [Peniophora sp. CONT]
MSPNIVQRFARVYEKSHAACHTTITPSEVVPDEDDPDLADIPGSSSSSNDWAIDAPSTDDLVDLWDEAVCQYRDITGIDLRDETSEPALHQRLEGCFDVHKLNRALDSMALDFDVYRGSSRKDIGGRIRRALKPVIRAALVVLDVGGEAASTVPGGKAIFVAIGVLFKTTQEVSKRFDAVATLLEEFSFYLVRLNLGTRATLEGPLRALAIEILAHMLCSFAIVTKMMRRNRIGWYVRSSRGRQT